MGPLPAGRSGTGSLWLWIGVHHHRGPAGRSGGHREHLQLCHPWQPRGGHRRGRWGGPAVSRSGLRVAVPFLHLPGGCGRCARRLRLDEGHRRSGRQAFGDEHELGPLSHGHARWQLAREPGHRHLVRGRCGLCELRRQQWRRELPHQTHLRRRHAAFAHPVLSLQRPSEDVGTEHQHVGRARPEHHGGFPHHQQFEQHPAGDALVQHHDAGGLPRFLHGAGDGHRLLQPDLRCGAPPERPSALPFAGEEPQQPAEDRLEGDGPGGCRAFLERHRAHQRRGQLGADLQRSADRLGERRQELRDQ